MPKATTLCPRLRVHVVVSRGYNTACHVCCRLRGSNQSAARCSRRKLHWPSWTASSRTKASVLMTWSVKLLMLRARSAGFQGRACQLACADVLVVSADAESKIRMKRTQSLLVLLHLSFLPMLKAAVACSQGRILHQYVVLAHSCNWQSASMGAQIHMGIVVLIFYVSCVQLRQWGLSKHHSWVLSIQLKLLASSFTRTSVCNSRTVQQPCSAKLHTLVKNSITL